MKINSTFVLLACAGGLSIWGASTSLGIEDAAAQEQTVECADVPAAVRMAFQKAYPKAITQGCSKEIENGKTAYEISSTEGKTRRDILYYEDGTLIVVEEAIEAADLPKPVQQALSEVLKDHKIELVEKLRRDDTLTYEIKSKHAGVALEIVFDGNGKVLKIAAGGTETSPAGIEDEAKSEKKTESGGEEAEEEAGEK
jgi:hypothetical protein